MYDADRNILYERLPAYVHAGESNSIELPSNIEAIKFWTNSSDGFHGWVNVTMNRENQLFQCINCLKDSPSTKLALLYLDMDLKWPHDLPGAAYCNFTCTFVKIATEVTTTTAIEATIPIIAITTPSTNTETPTTDAEHSNNSSTITTITTTITPTLTPPTITTTGLFLNVEIF